jgi:hypothetical protein
MPDTLLDCRKAPAEPDYVRIPTIVFIALSRRSIDSAMIPSQPLNADRIFLVGGGNPPCFIESLCSDDARDSSPHFSVDIGLSGIASVQLWEDFLSGRRVSSDQFSKITPMRAKKLGRGSGKMPNVASAEFGKISRRRSKNSSEAL